MSLDHDLEAELEKLAMDTWGAPQWIIDAHAPDQGPQICLDLRPTGAFPYLGWLLISGTAVNVPAGCLAPHQLTRSSADHHRNARRMSASLLLFQGGEVPARHASIGFDYSFDKRVFRQVFVVLSYDCLGLL